MRVRGSFGRPFFRKFSESEFRNSLGQKVSRSWPAGESTLVWPVELALVDGENYFSQLEHAIGATEMTLRLIPTSLDTDAHRAAWMAENGCLKQAHQVLRGLSQE